MTESCGNCKFFRRVQPMQPMGKCHRNPPVTYVVGQQKTPLGQVQTLADSFWPVVPDTDFCGEWKIAGRPAAASIDLTTLDVKELEGRA